MQSAPHIDDLRTSAFSIPTETEESDGTFTWGKTTLVLTEAVAGGQTGLGYTYADRATAVMIDDALRDLVAGRSVMDVRGTWDMMCRAVRNLGRPGVCSMAISAVDAALWDLKARVIGVPLVSLLGQARETMPIYGSGGFCNYDNAKLREQLEGWVSAGVPRVKMKIGRDQGGDLLRVAAAREAIGPAAELFVDANGAYSRKQALAQADAFSAFGVTWFEEPVSSDDLEGLRLLRDRAPAGMDVAAGEYAYRIEDFLALLQSGAVDVLQADATRCCGLTGFQLTAALCDAFHVRLSSHCAPALHLHVGCAVSPFSHAEYFFDHVRIEGMLFDGVPLPANGAMRPDLSRPGNGLVFKRADAEPFRIH